MMYINNLFEEAKQAHKEGDFSSIIGACSKIIKIEPDNEGALINLASAYNKLNEPDLAIKYSTKAFEINKNNWAALINRGAAHNTLGKFDLALKDYNLAREINPKRIFTYQNLGETYFHLGKKEKALENYSIALGKIKKEKKEEEKIQMYNHLLVSLNSVGLKFEDVQ